MPTVDIGKYFENRRDKFRQEVAALGERRQENEAAASRRITAMKLLQVEIKSKEKLKAQASQNNLDITPLDKDIARIRETIDTLQRQQEEEQRSPKLPQPAEPYDSALVSRFLKNLRSKSRVGAVPQVEVVSSLQAAAQLLTTPQRSLTVDRDGLVKKAVVRFAEITIGEVTVTSKLARYSASFIPDPLQWTLWSIYHPDPSDAAPEPKESSKVFVIEESQEVLLPTTRLLIDSRSVDSVLQEAGLIAQLSPSEELMDAIDACSVEPSVQKARSTGQFPPFVMASELLKDAIEQVGGKLDLDQSYTEPFLTRIQEQVIASTVDSMGWPRNKEYPNSDQVFAKIKDDLALLALAPWSDDIGGDWAKFKYTLENGERPRVWNKEHVDHYGIRVRTRDHSWLVGGIYIDRTEPPGSAGDPIEISHDGTPDPFGLLDERAPSTLTVGRMHMWLKEIE